MECEVVGSNPPSPSPNPNPIPNPIPNANPIPNPNPNPNPNLNPNPNRVNLSVSFSAWAELDWRYLLEVTNTVNPSSIPGSTLKNCSNQLQP